MKRGTVVRERYTIQALAGTGGMGSVYRAVDPEGQLVALKVLSGGRQRMDMRFTREARILMRLKHPHIVRCLDSGVTKEGARFLVMEWLDGTDVDSYLRTQTFTLDQGLELAEIVARALGFAHAQNMVHRDVKPSNIFLANGDVSTVKLLDFGVARWTDATSLTATGMQIGTPSYMAPEQIRGDSSVGPTADVFSLGCVLFKCLTGKMAFGGNNRVAVFYKILLNELPRISDVADNVPEPVSDLLERLLAKEAEKRPKDGNEAAEEIARIRVELADDASRRLRQLDKVPSALTSSERQLVSVVVVAARGPEEEDSDVSLSNRGVTVLLEDHSENEEALSTLRDLRARHESVGVSFDSLPNGSLIAVLDSRRTATDQAAAAARCALELHQALDSQPVAVATGRAEAGQTYHRLDDIIERAVAMLTPEHRAKIEASTDDQPPLYLDDMTAGLVETRFQLSGNPGFQVLVSESHKTDQPVLLGKRTPFVGRRREMATLSAILDECVDDDVARAVLITGPPGIGKSRLQREFITSLEEKYDHVEIWHGRGDPMRSGSPLEVIAQAIRDSADIREDEAIEIRRDKLRTRVARTVVPNRVEQVSAFIGKLIKTPWAFDRDVQLQAANADARLMGDRVRQACEELLASDLRSYPVLIIIDDFQWCSRATAAWIDRILRNLSEKPLMVAAFARPEVHESFPDLWSSHDPDEVHLRSLSKRASNELVRAVLGRQFNSPRVAELVERADGNALYLEGLMRSAKAGLQKLPDSMLAMVHSRLNELPAEVRRALRAASVFGKRFWSGGVTALLGDEKQTQGYLHSLLISELVDKANTSTFADQAEYRFRHDVIREAAYTMLTDEDRSTGHRLAGAWLEQIGETDALVIAVHYERGGALDKAQSFFERAAAHACNNGDFESAISLADRGAECGAEGAPLGRLLAIQTKAHYWSGRLQQAALDGEHAIAELPRGSGSWYEAIDMTSLARFRLGQAYEVERYARWLAPQPPDEENEQASDAFKDHFEDEFEDSLTDLDTSDLDSEGPKVSRRRRGKHWLAPPPPADHDRMGWLRLGADLSGHLFRDGRVDMARALLARVELEIGELEDTAPWLAARVLSAQAIRATLTEGNPSAALRETLRAVALYHQAGDKRRACLETVNVGRAQIELGQFEAAAASLRSSLSTAIGLAVDFLVDLAKLYTSVALSQHDALDKALVLAQSCADNFEKRGNRRLAATTYIHLAHFYLRDENLEAAEAATRQAMSTCSKTSPVHAHALATRARLLLSTGQAVEALSSTVQALTLMEKFGSVDEGEALIRLVYAESLHACGQHAAARIAITQARNRLRYRSKLIDRPDWRRSFLRDVPANTRTLELAKQWSQRSPSESDG